MSYNSADPLVSVIIPVFNVAPFIEEALNSVIHQTYYNLEVLIIDDGSTDGSEIICEMYCSDPRVKVIHQENCGLSCARNIGLDHAAGDYIAFLDPDDAFQPEFVSTMLRIITIEETELVACEHTVCRTSGNMKRCTGKNKRQESEGSLKQGLYRREDALRALIDERIDVSVWNKLYRRELWDTIRFPLGRNYEDIDTMYKIIDRTKSVYILAESLYLHRKRIGSITETLTIKNMQDRNIALAHEESFIASHVPDIFSEEQLRRFRQRYMDITMVQFIKSKDRLFSRDIERQIIDLIEKIGLQRVSFRTKIAFKMLSLCPWLLRTTYSIYLPTRLLIWKLTRQ